MDRIGLGEGLSMNEVPEWQRTVERKLAAAADPRRQTQEHMQQQMRKVPLRSIYIAPGTT
jgi:hypothetical protein